MSFIQTPEKQGKVYAPGYFLAHEECVRETQEIPVSLATTDADGSKYVKMGTVFPSNDSNAIGIVYEDVDVSTGNMPGSVVTKGVVIEDRIPAQNVEYDAVTPEGTENPSEEGWYEQTDDGEYIKTTDTTIDEDDPKTYYEAIIVSISDNAKSALEALGIKFVSEPTVTRPY